MLGVTLTWVSPVLPPKFACVCACVHGRELGLEQLFRDCRMLPIPDGTNQILALIEGRELTGIQAYRA